MHKYDTFGVSKAALASKNFARTQTVEFAVPVRKNRVETSSPVAEHSPERPAPDPIQADRREFKFVSSVIHKWN